MASELKAAVIGTGGAARLHMEAYARNRHTLPAAVCSGSAVRAEQFAMEFGVRPYTSVEQMLERERPDVVSVATLEWEHVEPVLLALEAGAHVLCEKPMAHSVAAGERMVEAARRAGRSLGVNFNYRSVPAHELIRQELQRGGFGGVGLFSAQMHAYLWPHLLDLMRYFFGDPVEVTAALVDEQALRPPVSAGPRGRPWEFQPQRAKLAGDPGYGGEFQAELLYHPSVAVAATFRFRDPEFIATMSGSALVPLEQNFWSFALYGSEDALVVDRATRANLNGTASLGKIAERIAELPACSYEESFALSSVGFVEALLQGRAAPVTGENGLAEMRLDAAIVEAARTGRAVKFSAR
jgi:predicted dehydrogenase